jgi:hypothetical protein
VQCSHAHSTTDRPVATVITRSLVSPGRLRDVTHERHTTIEEVAYSW